MNNKVLFVANIHKHIRAFHIPYIQYLQKQGYEVHVAANDGTTRIEEADKQFDLPISRNPFSFNNIKAIYFLYKIIKAERYCLVHCHTAMGAVVARLAAKQFRKSGLKVLYTAHGFHFFKGSSIIYWILYYPMEKYLSLYTDGIITINQEDYKLIKNKKFRNKLTFQINGVGINTRRLHIPDFEHNQFRALHNYKNSDFLILYIAEFIERKNHIFFIECALLLQKLDLSIKFLFAGRGKNMEIIKKVINEKGLSETINVLGFRSDIGNLIKMVDVGASASYQEGLPMNIAEQLFMSKPVIATKIRGHIDLINHGVNGFLFEINNKKEFIHYILELKNDKTLYRRISNAAKLTSEKYLLDNCMQQMVRIYKTMLPHYNHNKSKKIM